MGKKEEEEGLRWSGRGGWEKQNENEREREEGKKNEGKRWMR